MIKTTVSTSIKFYFIFISPRSCHRRCYGLIVFMAFLLFLTSWFNVVATPVWSLPARIISLEIVLNKKSSNWRIANRLSCLDTKLKLDDWARRWGTLSTCAIPRNAFSSNLSDLFQCWIKSPNYEELQFHFNLLGILVRLASFQVSLPFTLFALKLLLNLLALRSSRDYRFSLKTVTTHHVLGLIWCAIGLILIICC